MSLLWVYDEAKHHGKDKTTHIRNEGPKGENERGGRSHGLLAGLAPCSLRTSHSAPQREAHCVFSAFQDRPLTHRVTLWGHSGSSSLQYQILFTPKTAISPLNWFGILYLSAPVFDHCLHQSCLILVCATDNRFSSLICTSLKSIYI